MPVASLKVPHFRQELPSSCVAACVRMVLMYFGHSCSETEVREYLDTGPHGTPARQLIVRA